MLRNVAFRRNFVAQAYTKNIPLLLNRLRDEGWDIGEVDWKRATPKEEKVMVPSGKATHTTIAQTFIMVKTELGFYSALALWRSLGEELRYQEWVILSLFKCTTDATIAELVRTLKATGDPTVTFSSRVATTALTTWPRGFKHEQDLSKFVELYYEISNLPHFSSLAFMQIFYSRVILYLAAAGKDTELKQLLTDLYLEPAKVAPDARWAAAQVQSSLPCKQTLNVVLEAYRVLGDGKSAMNFIIALNKRSALPKNCDLTPLLRVLELYHEDPLSYLTTKLPLSLWYRAVPHDNTTACAKWAAKVSFSELCAEPLKIRHQDLSQKPKILEVVFAKLVGMNKITEAISYLGLLVSRGVRLSNRVYFTLLSGVKALPKQHIEGAITLIKSLNLPASPKVAKAYYAAMTTCLLSLDTAAEAPFEKPALLIASCTSQDRMADLFTACSLLSMQYQNLEYTEASLDLLVQAGITSPKDDTALLKMLPHCKSLPVATELVRLYFDCLSAQKGSRGEGPAAAMRTMRAHVGSALGFADVNTILYMNGECLMKFVELGSLPAVAEGVKVVLPFSSISVVLDETEEKTRWKWAKEKKTGAHEGLRKLSDAIARQPEKYVLLTPLGEILLNSCARLPMQETDELAWAANLEPVKATVMAFQTPDQPVTYLGTAGFSDVPYSTVDNKLEPFDQPLVWGGVAEGVLHSLVQFSREVPVIMVDTENRKDRSHNPMSHALRRVNATAAHGVSEFNAALSRFFTNKSLGYIKTE